MLRRLPVEWVNRMQDEEQVHSQILDHGGRKRWITLGPPMTTESPNEIPPGPHVLASLRVRWTSPEFSDGTRLLLTETRGVIRFKEDIGCVCHLIEHDLPGNMGTFILCDGHYHQIVADTKRTNSEMQLAAFVSQYWQRIFTRGRPFESIRSIGAPGPGRISMAPLTDEEIESLRMAADQPAYRQPQCEPDELDEVLAEFPEIHEGDLDPSDPRYRTNEEFEMRDILTGLSRPIYGGPGEGFLEEPTGDAYTRIPGEEDQP